MSKRTVLESVAVDYLARNAYVKLQKQILDGETVELVKLHRITVEPGADVAQLLEGVSAQLDAEGYPTLSVENIAAIEAQVAVARG